MSELYTDQQSRFAKSFARSGTICSVECACGRVHFLSSSGHGDYEEGELAKLQQRAADDPEHFIEDTQFSSIDFCHIDGSQYVVACPCGKADIVAKWIESHADELADYLVLYFKDKADKHRAELNRAERLRFGLEDSRGSVSPATQEHAERG